MKRYLLPLVGGVTVFAAVSAFAATLNVSSTSLGSGESAVASCNSTAAVSYTTAYDATAESYLVATAPITSAAACSGKSFKVSLTGAEGVLAEQTGSLDTDGKAAPAFTGIKASSVTGVAVVVTG